MTTGIFPVSARFWGQEELGAPPCQEVPKTTDPSAAAQGWECEAQKPTKNSLLELQWGPGGKSQNLHRLVRREEKRGPKCNSDRSRMEWEVKPRTRRKQWRVRVCVPMPVSCASFTVSHTVSVSILGFHQSEAVLWPFLMLKICLIWPDIIV